VAAISSKHTDEQSLKANLVSYVLICYNLKLLTDAELFSTAEGMRKSMSQWYVHLCLFRIEITHFSQAAWRLGKGRGMNPPHLARSPPIICRRFVLAATEHLHKRIAKISDRVRQLEDALASLQAKHSNEPHPLLRDDLLSANAGHGDEDAGKAEDSGPSHPPEIMDAFGTLSISDHGVSRFFGPTGGPEVSNPSVGGIQVDCLTRLTTEFIDRNILPSR